MKEYHFTVLFIIFYINVIFFSQDSLIESAKNI